MSPKRSPIAAFFSPSSSPGSGKTKSPTANSKDHAPRQSLVDNARWLSWTSFRPDESAAVKIVETKKEDRPKALSTLVIKIVPVLIGIVTGI